MPTYVLYRTPAVMQPAEVVEIPYSADFQLPLTNWLPRRERLRLLSPNSPSVIPSR